MKYERHETFIKKRSEDLPVSNGFNIRPGKRDMKGRSLCRLTYCNSNCIVTDQESETVYSTRV